MLNTLIETYGSELNSLYYLILFVNAILHVIFAGAVAKDAGKLYKIGQKPLLVSAHTWAFAVLVGGVFTAIAYWFMHHSTLTNKRL
jgi:hypothetical protein